MCITLINPIHSGKNEIFIHLNRYEAGFFSLKLGALPVLLRDISAMTEGGGIRI